MPHNPARNRSGAAMRGRIFWTLLRLSFGATAQTRSTQRLPRSVARLLSLIMLIPLEIFLYTWFNALYVGLASFGAQAAEIGAAIVIVQVLSLFFGIIFSITSIYLSRDIESLLVLPIPPWLILAARFISMWTSELLSAGIFAVPAFLVYGVHGHSATLWARLLVLFLALPIVPLLLAVALTTVFMRMTNVGKLRDRFRLVAGLFGLAIYAVFRVTLGNHLASGLRGGQAAQSVLTGSHGVLTLIGRYYPPSAWATAAVALPFTQGGALGWLKTVCVIAGLVAIGVLWGQRWFLKGYLGSFDVTRKGRRTTSRTASARSGQTSRSPRTQDLSHGPISLLRTLWVKEFRTFLRTPTYVLNAFSSIVFIAIPILIPNGHAQAGNLPAGTLQGNLIYLVGALAIFVLGSSNAVAASSISREGGQLYFLKTLPVPAHLIVLAKWWFANATALVPAGFVILAEWFWLHETWYGPLLSLLLGGMTCAAFNAFSVWIDLTFPRLQWTNEQGAIKGFKNVGLMVGELLSAGILFGIGALLHRWLGWSWMVVDGIYVLLAGGLLVGGVSLMLGQAAARLQAIE